MKTITTNKINTICTQFKYKEEQLNFRVIIALKNEKEFYYKDFTEYNSYKEAHDLLIRFMQTNMINLEGYHYHNKFKTLNEAIA